MTALVLLLVIMGQISIMTAANFLAAFMYPFFIFFILLVIILTEVPDHKIRYYMLAFFQTLIGASIGFSFKVSLITGQYTPIDWPYVLFVFILESLLYYAVFWWEAKYEKIALTSGTETMIGDTAIVQSWSGNNGRISHEGTSWQANSASKIPLEKGDVVVIAELSGLLVTIKKQ